MWHPKNYLHPEIITALLMARFSPTEIEFLGWLSYTAAALNNSRNPVRAAHTLLANASEEGSNMNKMLMLFAAKKKDSVKPEKVAEHDLADQVFDNLKWLEREAILVGSLTSNGDDFTKGGISDGPSSITSEDPEREALSLQDEGESDE